ncbi:uncharacterized protein N7469_000772 [Penicillium citrinum]|uniref:Major facilitator superfamily (MFS) profile domain-containing protein n=1 Tax=Penicillium citrinum TaxID=5077 RepID=A0A9W9PDJ6_PENCI|nr:uncharacterized protein N7469_000772 [Penicillium citrinum]KAJ5242445.1 hypothetical protein N7469_000772 [Penicillium citrinum]
MHNLSAWQSAKENPRVVLFSLGTCLNSALWGFDVSVNAVILAMPGFKKVFGYEYNGELLISATWNALWSAMTFLGMGIGSLICGWFSDKTGRRSGFLAGCILSISGIGLQYAASRPGILLAGKIVNGFALGFFLALASTYTSEISPLPLRPILTAAINFFMNSGQLAAMAIGATRLDILTPSSYKTTFAAQWAFPCAIILFVLILPESPWYLIRNGKYKDAEIAIQRLYAKSPALTRGYLDVLRDTIESERSTSSGPSGSERVGARVRNFEELGLLVECFWSNNLQGLHFIHNHFIFWEFAGWI